MDWEGWQKRWDAQQDGYLSGREERFAAMLDVVEAARGGAPRVLDLAGGTGSISRRVLERFPEAAAVVLDVDPALLAIAAGSFESDPRVRVCRADLAAPAWRGTLGEPEGSFDAVLTATALHWLPAERVARVYAEAAALLAPGGVLANADHMADDGLGPLNDRIGDISRAAEERRRAATGAADWEGWWELLAREPEMAALVEERNRHFAERRGSHHTQSDPSVEWHLAALRDAGCAHAGVVWRQLGDAVVVGYRG